MHSGVQKFSVQLWGESDEIHLRVSDSGVGFDLRSARRGRELGLIRIEQRVKLVEGTLSIDSQPEKAQQSMLAYLCVLDAIPCVRLAECARNVARSQVRNGGVLRTDSLVDVAFKFTRKAVQYIPTQNIDVAALGDLVP